MKRRLIVAAAVLASALTATAVQAQDNWVLMGSKSIAVGAGRDTIDVSKARGAYKAVRLVDKRSHLLLDNVEVVYSTGPSHQERRTINLLEGDRTRPIDQRESAKFVDKVVLSFKSQSSSDEPAVIEVYGLQSDTGARETRSSGEVASASAANASSTASASGAATGNVSAQPGSAAAKGDAGEVLFGTQAVGFAVDRDVIRVGAEVGKFDKIRLRILDNDIHINSIKVIYTNGDSQELAYDAEAKKDTKTKWFDLKGDRFVKEIQLIYRARPNFRGQAYVEVYGQYAEGWLGTEGEGRKYNSGFVLLGAQTAGFTIDRNDIIKVGKNEGDFKRIEVRVRDQAITLFEVRVLYGNGEVDIIPANRTKVEAGGRFGPIDLKGGNRIVEEVRPTYRTRIFQQGGVARGRAVVEFWGQH